MLCTTGRAQHYCCHRFHLNAHSEAVKVCMDLLGGGEAYLHMASWDSQGTLLCPATLHTRPCGRRQDFTCKQLLIVAAAKAL